jgi:hypothetical protein
MGKGLKKEFFHRRHTHGCKYMQRWSTLFVIRQMKIKTTMKYHYTHTWMAIVLCTLCHCDGIPEKKTLKEGRFILAHALRGFS